MQVVDTIEALRAARKEITGRVGLVPTMGALHDGHLTLARTAREENDYVVVTIFVNPTQFGPDEDLAAYPRDLQGDSALLEECGVDLIFTPTPDLMYPAGYQTYVTVEGVTQGLEGDYRSGHFRGVTTVVAKLFNLVQPDIAYFGQKDAQQVVVIRRMAYDMNFSLKVAVCPTIRESDGLAMSSRNAYLTPDQRSAAVVLNRALVAAGEAYEQGQRDPQKLKNIMFDVLNAEPLAQTEYASVNFARTLKIVESASDEPLLLSMVARVGRARLLDNCLLPLSLNDRDGLDSVLGVPNVKSV